VLTGIRGREGLQVDAIGIMCAQVLSSGGLGPSVLQGTLTGGGGGTVKELSCAAGSVVTEFYVNYGAILNSVRVSCRPWNASKRQFESPLVFIGEIGALHLMDLNIHLACGAKTQPAAGIRGRSGSLVDSIGLICDEP